MKIKGALETIRLENGMAFCTRAGRQHDLVVRAPDLYSETPGLSPALMTWICFTVAPSSNPRRRFVNSQLVCLPLVGIFNMLFLV